MKAACPSGPLSTASWCATPSCTTVMSGVARGRAANASRQSPTWRAQKRQRCSCTGGGVVVGRLIRRGDTERLLPARRITCMHPSLPTGHCTPLASGLPACCSCQRARQARWTWRGQPQGRTSSPASAPLRHTQQQASWSSQPRQLVPLLAVSRQASLPPLDTRAKRRHAAAGLPLCFACCLSLIGFSWKWSAECGYIGKNAATNQERTRHPRHRHRGACSPRQRLRQSASCE